MAQFGFALSFPGERNVSSLLFSASDFVGSDEGAGDSETRCMCCN